MKTKTEMRVAIARDVIAQLNAALLIATEGTYTGGMLSDARDAGVRDRESLQPYLLRQIRKPCEVCALGAGVISLVRLNNEVLMGDGLDVYENLIPFFTEGQLNMLEDLFETFDGRVELVWMDPEARLRWLWNYVADNPDFTPEDMRHDARNA